MRIALINQFYPPARAPTGKLLADLAITLQGRGHQVTVLASSGLYGAAATDDDHPPSDEIQVIRLGADRPHGTSRLAKALDYGKFLLQARKQLSMLDPIPDAVVCMTTPPLCGRWVQRVPALRKAVHVLWCMDLYPEALVSAGWMGNHHPVYRVFARWAKHERENAAAVVVLGEDMRELVLDSAPSTTIHSIPVWTSLAPSESDQEAGRALRLARGWGDDQCIFLYSGNLGRAHDLTDFARLSAQSDPKKCRFVVCGEGPMLAAWRKQWDSCFEWLDPVDGGHLTAHLLSADVHLISQRPEWAGVVVPSKYQSACALARPVLFSGPVDSAVGHWICNGDTGWCLPPGDQGAARKVLAECLNPDILKQKGSAARQQAPEIFNVRENCNRLAGVIEDMV